MGQHGFCIIHIAYYIDGNQNVSPGSYLQYKNYDTQQQNGMLIKHSKQEYSRNTPGSVFHFSHPCVKPVPIRAGLSERWWTQLVLKIWRLFPVRKRTLQQGIYNIKSEYKELIHFKIHIYHYLIRIFPRYNQHNSMSISCELMPWHQLWQQLIRRYQLTTVAEKYINQTTTVNL